MIDPVCLSSGFSYEREAITKHFKINGFFDPVNREPVKPDIMIENKNLKRAVELFLQENPWAYKHIPGQTEDTMWNASVLIIVIKRYKLLGFMLMLIESFITTSQIL